MTKWTVTIPVLQYDVYTVETEREFADQFAFADWFWNVYMPDNIDACCATYGGDSGEAITYERLEDKE